MSHRYRGRKLGEMKPDGYVRSESRWRGHGDVESQVTAGDSIRWGSWDDVPSRGIETPLTLIPYASGSDYSGTLVERSNYEHIVDNYADEVVTISGGYGTFGVAFLGRAEDLSEDLQDVIAGLHDYPLVDESLHSEMEWNHVIEAWQDHGRDAFRRAVCDWLTERNIPTPEGEDVDWELNDCDDVLDALWRDNEGDHRNGQGSEIYFYIDEFMSQRRIVDKVFYWLYEHFDIDYVRPESENGRILADAIHDWFLPFAEVSCDTQVAA